MEASLKVRSHVSRDLLQSAAVFKHDPPVVWEYVSNELQYVDPGTSPVVKVRLDSKNKKISVSGNGRGMDWDDLDTRFFVMHGENVDRKTGDPGRGRFGTGKSAAFGIGDLLRLSTVRNGKRTKVELRRDDIEEMDGEEIPVTTIEREVATDEPNGTLIEIEGIHLRSLDQAGVIRYVERHLAKWPRDVTVLVNNHQCEVAEPPIEKVETFEASKEESAILGNVSLAVKISKAPLDRDSRGIAIFSNGVWHETTMAGCEGKDMAEFLFGEVDVPRLDEDDSKPPAFDLSRSMQLNPHNPLVQSLHGFIGPKLEQVRKGLVAEQRKAKESEEARRLEREASNIESIINSDFTQFRKRLQKVKAASAGAGFDVAESDAQQSGSGDDDFLYGGEDPATVTNEKDEPGVDESGEGGDGDEPRRLNPVVEPDEKGKSHGHPEGKKEKKKRRPRGGFHIEFRDQGVDSARAEYQSESRTIYINLEHPQIATAKQGRSAEDPTFRRLAYEVAFSEYAVALAAELDQRGEFIDPSDPIYEIRQAINRVARQAAPLYA